MTTISTPPDAPSRADPSNFASKADAFLAWLVGFFVPEVNTVIGEMNDAASAAADSASDASTAATAAAGSATAAAASAAAAAASNGVVGSPVAASGVVSSSFSFPDLDEDWELEGTDIYFSTAGARLDVCLQVGGVDLTTSVYSHSLTIVETFTASPTHGEGSSSIPLTSATTVGGSPNSRGSFRINVLNPSATTRGKVLEFKSTFFSNGSGDLQHGFGSGHVDTTSAADGITVFVTSGTFTGNLILRRKTRA